MLKGSFIIVLKKKKEKKKERKKKKKKQLKGQKEQGLVNGFSRPINYTGLSQDKTRIRIITTIPP